MKRLDFNDSFYWRTLALLAGCMTVHGSSQEAETEKVLGLVPNLAFAPFEFQKKARFQNLLALIWILFVLLAPVAWQL